MLYREVKQEKKKKKYLLTENGTIPAEFFEFVFDHKGNGRWYSVTVNVISRQESYEEMYTQE